MHLYYIAFILVSRLRLVLQFKHIDPTKFSLDNSNSAIRPKLY